jgi:hypothetical protein
VGSVFKELSYSSYSYSGEVELKIVGKGTRDTTFWNVLAFDNLTNLEDIVIENCTPVPLHLLQMLKSLKTIHIRGTNFLLPTERDNNVRYKFPVERIDIRYCSASGKKLTQMLSHFPYMIKLDLMNCYQVSDLGVAVEEQPEMATPASTSAITMDEAKNRQQKRQAEGLLLLPAHIHSLSLSNCPQLSHVTSSIGEGQSAGGGLQGLRSLQSLYISGCPMLLSSNLSCYFLFPTSLQMITLDGTPTSLTLPPLPNLINLTISNAPHLTGEDLLPLLSQGKLTVLTTIYAPNFFIRLKAARLSGIQTVRTEAVPGFLIMPICKILSSTLTSLFLKKNSHMESFTKHQEKALQLLTSLKLLEISYYEKLQFGPAGLSELRSLTTLAFWGCPALQSLPKDSIPSSLEILSIDNCPQLRTIPKCGLQKSSLRGLLLYDVNKELEKQCYELTETIPIFRERFYYDK